MGWYIHPKGENAWLCVGLAAKKTSIGSLHKWSWKQSLTSQGLHAVLKCDISWLALPKQLDYKCAQNDSAIVRAVWSRKTHIYRVWLPAECIARALSMLSIHSPDYVFMVLVSIFMKAIIISDCHPSAINTFSLVYIVTVTEFSASTTCTCALQTIRTTYERTYASSTMSWHSGQKV